MCKCDRHWFCRYMKLSKLCFTITSHLLMFCSRGYVDTGPQPSGLKWSGSQCIRKHVTGMGVWRHAPPENFWNLEAVRLLLRSFLGQYNASWRPDDRVPRVNIYPFCPLHHIQHWFQLSDIVRLPHKAHPSLMRLVRLIVRTGKLLEHSQEFFCKFQHVTCVRGGVHQVMVLISNAKQAMSEGKSGLVETGLTRPAATALSDRIFH